jgi:drug/metabolite transporter (DMT)-like permease
VLLGLRMGISLPFFLAISWWLGRGKPPMTLRQRLAAAILGVLGFHAATWLDFQGLRFIDVALERMVIYLYPTLVVLIGVACGRQRLTPVVVGALLATYAGVALTWSGDIHVDGYTSRGVALVAASAIAYAIYLVAAEPWITAVGGLRFISAAMSAACASVLIQALATQPLQAWVQPGVVYGIGWLLAIPGMVIPSLLTGLAIRRIGPARFSIISTLGPVSTVLLGMAVLGEHPTALAWLGIALTIAGGAAIGLADHRRDGG